MRSAISSLFGALLPCGLGRADELYTFGRTGHPAGEVCTVLPIYDSHLWRCFHAAFGGVWLSKAEWLCDVLRSLMLVVWSGSAEHNGCVMFVVFLWNTTNSNRPLAAIELYLQGFDSEWLCHILPCHVGTVHLSHAAFRL